MDVTRRMFIGGLVSSGLAGCAVTKAAGTPGLDPNKVVFISDIHVALPWSEQKYRTGREYPHVNRRIQEFVAEILRQPTLPANVIGLGDISLAFAEEKEYRLCREFLRPLEDAGITVTMALGNHDRVAEFLTAFPEHEKHVPVRGKIVSEVSTPHADFLVLDSHTECADGKRGRYEHCTGRDLGSEQLAWLNERLARATKPTFLCAHHISSDLKLDRILGRSPQVFGYFHGHHHHWMTNYAFDGYGKSAHVVRVFGLPSFGLDFDVGWGELDLSAQQAVMTCHARGFYFPVEDRASEGGPVGKPASWAAFPQDWDGRRITFAYGK